MEINNPLRQYFRRPAIYIKLPSGGKFYDNTVIEPTETGELPVFPMTAIDEITAKTPDALFNGEVIVELMKSCVPNIKNPWAIVNDDLDSILLSIRLASNGDKIELVSTCPKCQNTENFELSLSALLTSIKMGNYDEPLSTNGLTIKFKPYRYKEINQAAIEQLKFDKQAVMLLSADENTPQDEIDARAHQAQQLIKKLTEFTMELVASSIEYIETPSVKVEEPEYILDFLRNCDNSMYVAIQTHSTKIKEPSQIKPIKMKCVECEHEYEQPFDINPSTFFG